MAHCTVAMVTLGCYLFVDWLEAKWGASGFFDWLIALTARCQQARLKTLCVLKLVKTLVPSPTETQDLNSVQ